jgi:hypothetical protein
MVSMLTLRAVDSGFKSRSGQTKDYKIGICCFSTKHFSAISWWEQVKFQWNDDEIRFVLDQHAELDFYSATASSLIEKRIWM